MIRDRAWLRSFLRLDAQQAVEHLSDAAIRLQEDTVLAALQVLEQEPGVLLADEVGMGKTFQALGLIAATFQGRAEPPRVLVITPTRDLNHQWLRAAQAFRQNGFSDIFSDENTCEIDHITALPRQTQRCAVVFAPVGVFTSARGHGERGFLLELWCDRRGLNAATRARIRGQIKAAGVQLSVAPSFLGSRREEFEALPEATFKRASAGELPGLDDLYEEGGIAAFSRSWWVKKALDRARFHVVGSVLPAFDLLIVDEAHKLKNPHTVQAQAVTQVLGGRFRRAVFLTATPFQLGVHELRRVFEMFGRASEVRSGFSQDVEQLFAAIGDYQRTYDAFEDAWRFAEPHHAAAFAAWYARVAQDAVAADPACPAPGLDAEDDPNVAALAQQAWSLLRLKEHAVEPGFRRWTIRSLKPGKQARRRSETRTLAPDAQAIAPLLLYQRLLLERARSGVHAHVEAAETNIASSFAAAREGALVTQDATPQVQAYQALVGSLLTSSERAHPKVASVLERAMAAADRWEKSLVFCERNATIDSLHAEIEARWMGRLLERWQRLYPERDFEGVFGAGSGAARTVGVFQRWATRFTRGQDQLSIALRESYPNTLLAPPDEPALPRALYGARAALLADANAVLRAQRASAASAARPDYRLIQRCVDVAVARWFERHRPAVLDGYRGVPHNLLHPDYPRAGLSLELEPGDQESFNVEIAWTITEAHLRTLLSRERPSIWAPLREALAIWEPAERESIVEAVGLFLTRRQVPFILEVLEASRGASATSADLRATLERLWCDPAWPWRSRVAALLDYLPRLSAAERAEVLGEALKRGEFAGRGNQSERRQALQDAFNTPFFPMILIGNRTMQEGLNLQRQCRRIVHHDLRWNPADLEQRVGRLDRHGSLAERRLAETAQAEGHLLIDIPLLERTIDPPRYRRVKEREKWLDFLLGAPPRMEQGLEARVIEPLPDALTEALRVRLGPPEAP